MDTRLSELCEDWQEWASSADTSEDGWQSDFPHWSNLISVACTAMIESEPHADSFSQIELCWKISEETEDMADFAKEHVKNCWHLLVKLAQSKNADVRWQVYTVLPFAGRNAEQLLRNGLNDPDVYCRRRALISLAHLHPSDSAELKARFTRDSDPYIRKAADEFKT